MNRTRLHVYKPWPFQIKKIKPWNRTADDGLGEYIAGRELGAFLYTSVPSRLWDGLRQFMKEKE